MKQNIKISIDYDGCLAKTSDFICELINFKTGNNHTYKEIDRWSYWDDINLGKEFWAAYDFLDKNGRLLIKPYDKYVFDSLDKLNSNYGSFDVVTANNEIAVKDIANWINYYGGYDGDMYWLDFKINCIGRKTAAEKLSLDYDLYIDDNPNLAAEMVNFPNKFLLLANCPWNKNILDSENIKRFKSWKEIPELIESI